MVLFTYPFILISVFLVYLPLLEYSNFVKSCLGNFGLLWIAFLPVALIRENPGITLIQLFQDLFLSYINISPISYFQFFFLHIYPTVELLNHVVVLVLLFDEPPYCFLLWVYHFTFPMIVFKDSNFSTSLPVFVIFWFSFLNDGHPNRCEVISL